MSKRAITLTGLSETRQSLEGVQKALAGTSLQEKIRGLTFTLLAEMQVRSPVGQGLGLYKRSWSLDTSIPNGASAGATLFNPLHYAGAVTFGSPLGGRPWPGPRYLTRESGGKVYSRQAPEGVVNEKILADVADDVSKTLLQGID